MKTKKPEYVTWEKWHLEQMTWSPHFDREGGCLATPSEIMKEAFHANSNLIKWQQERISELENCLSEIVNENKGWSNTTSIKTINLAEKQLKESREVDCE